MNTSPIALTAEAASKWLVPAKIGTIVGILCIAAEAVIQEHLKDVTKRKE